MKTWIIVFALAAAAPAYADQCESVDAVTAQKAQLLLASHPKVIAFCEPCGDRAPGLPVVAASVEAGTDVRINGSPVDLAYTYVQTSDARYQNLAMLVGCEVDDVSPSLKVADETTTGVMIVADSAPVVAPVVASPPPQVVVFSTHTRDSLPWLTIVLAGAASFAMSLGGILVFARLRRRRAMKPRATDLRVK